MGAIRILFYTDYDEMTDVSCSEFGLSELKRLILHKTQPLCGILQAEIKSINRHRDLVTGAAVKGANRLTVELLKQFDEIWVFGFLQTNTIATSENELGNDEVFNLRAWMNAGGGVFVTGDHANPDPRLDPRDERNKDPETYLNLGRALGYRIPRAGQLRVWEGPPTSVVKDIKLEDRDNYNTLVGQPVTDLDQADYLQTDGTAQELILNERPFPHRLFWWYLDKNECIVPITKFPDHMHEGKLQIPTALNGDWTAPVPFPEVVAYGRDNRPFRKERTYPLVIAYDGNLICDATARVGRIVADSSFHHYVNTNLLGFQRDLCGNPLPISDLDQIAQYFANLVLWLAPQNVLDLIKAKLMILLVGHPQILEIKGNNIYSLGRTALTILTHSIGLANLYQLFSPSAFDSKPREVDIYLSLLMLGRSGTLTLNEDERIDHLGKFITQLHETLTLEQLMDLDSLLDKEAKLDVIEGHLRDIFRVSMSSISQLLESGADGIEAFLQSGCDQTETPQH